MNDYQNLKLPICPKCNDTKGVSVLPRKDLAISTPYHCHKCNIVWEGTKITPGEPKDRYNFLIRFDKRTWLLEQYGQGDEYSTRAVRVEPLEFGVLAIHNSGDYSAIHCWSDFRNDGQNSFFINVPNSLFKIVGSEAHND